MAPHVKHFLWLTFKGRISTSDHLYPLNLGPEICVSFVVLIMNLLSSKIGKCLTFPDGFGFGVWLTNYNYLVFVSSVITAGVWFIWKTRSDVVFRNVPPNCSIIVCWAFTHAIEFSQANMGQFSYRMILNNFSNTDGLFLFSSMTWNGATEVGGAGFFLFNSNHTISLVRCCSTPIDTNFVADLKGLIVTLQVVVDACLRVQHLLTNSIVPGILILGSLLSDNSSTWLEIL